MLSSTQPSPTRGPKVNLSHAILTMLNAINLAGTSAARSPEARIAAIDKLRFCDKGRCRWGQR